MPSLEEQLRVRRAALSKLQGQLGGKEAQKRRLENKLSSPRFFSDDERAEIIRKYNALRDDIAQIEKRVNKLKQEIRALESRFGR